MLLNMLGQVVFEADNLWQETAVLPRGVLAAGLYSVVLLDGMGMRYVGRVVALE